MSRPVEVDPVLRLDFTTEDLVGLEEYEDTVEKGTEFVEPEDVLTPTRRVSIVIQDPYTEKELITIRRRQRRLYVQRARKQSGGIVEDGIPVAYARRLQTPSIASDTPGYSEVVSYADPKLSAEEIARFSVSESPTGKGISIPGTIAFQLIRFLNDNPSLCAGSEYFERLIEPVIETSPREARKRGLDFVYSSQVDQGPIVPSCVPLFPYGGHTQHPLGRMSLEDAAIKSADIAASRVSLDKRIDTILSNPAPTGEQF